MMTIGAPRRAPTRSPARIDRERRKSNVAQHSNTYRGETRNLVTQALGRNDRDVIRDALVRGEVKREARVVLLDDLARRLREK
jgi:hypothetical protein